MIINSIKIQNFKRYRKREFNFNLGLTGLLGKNGSGKSTIFEAIIFALYGECSTKKELLKNVSASNKEPLEVELVFEIDSKEYLIKRQLRGKNLTAKAELYDSSGELSASGAKEVTAEIIKLIDMSKEAFTHTVYASQKELSALSKLKSEERKKIIRRLLGLEKIDRIENELVIKIRELKRDIKSFGELLLSSDEIAKIKQEIKELKAAFKKEENELKKLNSNLKSAVATVKTALQKVEEHQKLKESYIAQKNELDKLKLMQKNLIKSLQKTKNEIKNLLEEEKFYNKNRQTLNRFQILQKELLKHQKDKELSIKKDGLLKEQESLREQLKGLKKDIQKLKTEIEKKGHLQDLQTQKEQILKSKNSFLQNIQEEKNNLLKEYASAKALIDNTKKQLTKIKKLGKTSACPICTRALLDEYETVVFSLTKTVKDLTDSKLNKLTISLQGIDKQINETNKKKSLIEQDLKRIYGSLKTIENLEPRLKELNSNYNKVLQKGLQNKEELKKLEGLKYDKTAHQKLQSELKQIEPVYKKLLSVQKLIEQIPKLKEFKESLKRELQENEQKIAQKESRLKEHKYDSKLEIKVKEEYQAALKLKEKVQEQIKKTEIQKVKFKEQKAAKEQTLAQNSTHLEKLRLKEQERDDYEKLKLFLFDFKSKINSQLTPRISKTASEMFYEVTGGKYQFIEVDDNFNFYIYDEGRRYPIERFSGGEVDLANLVLRIAISKTLNELNSNTNIGFLAFDEIFGSQDEQRRYAIMESFNKISSNYRQIFLISHEKEIKEMFEFVIEL